MPWIDTLARVVDGRLVAADSSAHRPAELSAKEEANVSRHHPVDVLARELARDAAFLEAVEDVRAGRASVDRVAERYVLREGRPRDVMRHVIGRAAASESPNPQVRVLGVATTATWVTAPLSESDPKQWTHAKRHREAASMLAGLGSGRCLRCSARLAADRPRRRYCSAHAPRGRLAAKLERSDREAILTLLNGAAVALRV